MEEHMDMEFICAFCGFTTFDEEEIDECSECGKKMCEGCLTTIEHQGYSETICVSCDPKARPLFPKKKVKPLRNQIEDTIADEYLPVNTIAMATRLIGILTENDVNSFKLLKDEEAKLNYRRVLWLINQQVHGQVGSFDMGLEWEYLTLDMG